MNVLIADDHELVRKSLVLLVRQLRSDANCVQAGSIRALKAACETARFDLVMLDPGLPDLPCLSDFAPDRPAIGDAILIVVSGSDRPADMRAAVDLGARGFLSKGDPSDVTVKALDLILAGGSVFPPEALQQPAPAQHAIGAKPAAEAVTLTPRQTELLRLLAEGHANAEIAARLCISDGTVRVHISNLFRRLGVTSRTQAALRARDLGI